MFQSGVQRQITVRGFQNDESLSDIFENDKQSEHRSKSSKYNFGAAAARAAKNHSSFKDSQKSKKKGTPGMKNLGVGKGSEINIARTLTRRSNFDALRRGSGQPQRLMQRLDAGHVTAQRSEAILNDVKIEDVDKTYAGGDPTPKDNASKDSHDFEVSNVPMVVHETIPIGGMENLRPITRSDTLQEPKSPARKQKVLDNLRKDRAMMKNIHGIQLLSQQKEMPSTINSTRKFVLIFICFNVRSKKVICLYIVMKLQKSSSLTSTKLQHHSNKSLKTQEKLYNIWRGLDLVSSTLAAIGLGIAIYSDLTTIICNFKKMLPISWIPMSGLKIIIITLQFRR
ncbi:hypothetical protein FGO68_gene2364 [Halteria grandinella]|uniref:Uncharacterized protein n=1 Tax=Halteria grandinella TaxID=5974 RepID=A0A8J8T8C8_HALGN|nr:hypothetical protein FGO68_gene2364 [Halteria grandinella]